MEAETDFMKIRHYVIDTVATNGNLPVRFPPTRKLAEMFGVSQPTALRAVRALIEEGYLTACKGGGTLSRPTTLALGNQLKIYGLLTYQGRQVFDDLFFMGITSTAAKELMRRNCYFRTKTLYVETPSLLEKTVRQESLAGLILLYAENHIAAYAANLRKAGFPVVSFVKRLEGISSVYEPVEERVHQTLLKLFREGRTHVLILSRPDIYSIAPIRAGAARACAEAGIPVGQVIILEKSMAESKEKISELLEFGVKFDAVFFYSFHHAIYELLQSRFDFQEECRIICDDTSVTNDLNYTGYVVHYDLENAAKKLIDLLLNQTEHPEEPPQYAHVDFDMVLYRNGIPVKQTC